MKRVFIILLSLTLIFGLCSCGSCLFGDSDSGEEEKTPSDNDNTTAVRELKFEKTDDKRYYIVTGIGTYTGEHVVIPKLYNGRAVKSVAEGAFSSNTTIKTLTVEEGVEKIGASAFSGCTSLESVKIAKTLEKIDSSAFEGCSALKTLIFGKGITNVGKNVFSGCDAIENFYYEGTASDFGSITGSSWWNLSYKTRYLYSESYPAAAGYLWRWSSSGEPEVWVDYIGNAGLKFAISDDGTYYKVTGNSNMNDKSVLIPKAHSGLPVGEIDAAAFVSANLEEITIPETVTKISGIAFKWCDNLKSIKLPDSVEIIGESAFIGCTSLETVRLSNSLTEIGNNAFLGCTALKSVEIPNSVKAIGSEAFYGCTGIISVTLGEGVETIGDRAFNLCTSLKSVVIPKTLKTLSDGLFGDCMDMEYAVIHSTVTDIGKKAFHSSAKIYYEGSAEAWSTVNKEESNIMNIYVYIYSSEEPLEEGKFWRWDGNGNISVW